MTSPLRSGSSIRIPPGRQRVVFDFAGLNLSVPEPRSLSIQAGWVRSQLEWASRSRREAIYTNLSPGPIGFM